MKTTSKIILLGLIASVACTGYAQKGSRKSRKEEKKTVAKDTIVQERFQISIADVKGTDDDDEVGIDIAELKEHKVIVEEKSSEEKPFVTVEQMPSFHGGDAKMMQFVADSLKYPVKAAEQGIQGRVIVRFVVDKDGSIKDAKIIRGIDPLCDREAVRVVKAMPKWVPGKQNGRNVPVYFTLPITFRL